jgi:hypothetical protein
MDTNLHFVAQYGSAHNKAYYLIQRFDEPVRNLYYRLNRTQAKALLSFRTAPVALPVGIHVSEISQDQTRLHIVNLPLNINDIPKFSDPKRLTAFLRKETSSKDSTSEGKSTFPDGDSPGLDRPGTLEKNLRIGDPEVRPDDLQETERSTELPVSRDDLPKRKSSRGKGRTTSSVPKGKSKSHAPKTGEVSDNPDPNTSAFPDYPKIDLWGDS